MYQNGDIKKFFETLSKESDAFLEERLKGLSPKTQQNIQFHIFNFDIKGLNSAGNKFARPETYPEKYEYFFNERNKLIKILT